MESTDKVQTYSVGPNESGDPDDAKEFVWIVTWYEEGDYCGTGESVGLHKNGRIYSKNLSHCSCYGPFEGGLMEGSGASIDDFLGSNALSGSEYKEINAKVRELLGIEIDTTILPPKVETPAEASLNVAV